MHARPAQDARRSLLAQGHNGLICAPQLMSAERPSDAPNGGYTRAGDDRRWLPSVTWFLARPRLAFRDLRQARRTAGRKALTAKLPGHRGRTLPDGLRRVTRRQVTHPGARPD